MSVDLLLTPTLRRSLEGLRWAPRKSFAGKLRGERLTRKKGISIEFADYRDYAEGDDLRHLDWNVLARLNSAVIKTYQDEEDLSVHVLLDCTASMGFGEPSKFEAARELAAACGYVALAGFDALRCRGLGVGAPTRTLRRLGAYRPYTAHLSGLEPTSNQSVSQLLKAFASASEPAGLVVVLSDGLDPEVFSAVRVLGSRGHEVLWIQVLSPLDLNPDLEGDLRLIDAESGAVVELTANGPVVRMYRERLAAHNAQLKAEVLRIGGRYLPVTVGEALDKTVERMRRDGWLAS